MTHTKNLIKFLAIIGLFLVAKNCYGGRVLFLSPERATIVYIDRNVFPTHVFKSKLLSQKDPYHYVTLNLTTKITLDTNTKFSFYFYQLLSNTYKRSFVELHYDVCDLLENDQIIGDAVREAYYREPASRRMMPVLKCPLPPGHYDFPNMKFRLTPIMETFPFRARRVFGNATVKGKHAVDGYLDFQLMTLRTK